MRFGVSGCCDTVRSVSPNGVPVGSWADTAAWV